MNNDGDFYKFLTITAITLGVIGWGIIELIIWGFSFVHISFGGG